MKRVALLFSAFWLVSHNVYSVENASKACEDDKQSVACQAYISGVVEGYIASKQKYLNSSASFEHQYANKAYATRVGNAHARLATNKPKPACLPNEVDTQEVVQHLATLNENNDLTVELGDYLRENYPCNK